MSSPPTKYLRYFDFTTFATLNPEKPLPGASVDVEFNRLKSTTDQTIDRLALIQRDDGALKDGLITTASINDGAVTEPKLATGAVSTRALGFASVDNTKLQPNAVTESVIANQNVTTQKLADLSVTTAKLADASVTGPKIAPGALSGGALAPGSVTSLQLQDGGVATVDLADGAVTTPKIADVNVTTPKLADGAVTGPKIANGAVDSSKLAPGAVTPAAIPDGSITGAKLAPGSVGSVQLGDGGIATVDLADGAVTNPKLALNAVASGNILPLAVGTTHLADLSVTTAKLADNAVTSGKIADGAIDPADLSVATLTLITSAGTPRGQWLTATNYNVRDAVSNQGGIYSATVTHLSGVFATDLASGKWLQTGQVFDQNLNTTDSVQFAKVWLGGKTAAFPMLVNSGAELHAKLADNSSFASIRAQNFIAQALGGNFYGGFGVLGGVTDGIAQLSNLAGTDFSRLQFGGTTAAFPSLKRFGTSLIARLADDSAGAPFSAASLTVTGAVAPVNGMFLSGANQLGWAVNSGTVMTLDAGLFHVVPIAQFDGNVGVRGPANPLWAAAFKVLQVGNSAHYDAGTALGLSSNSYYDGANNRYASANASTLLSLDNVAGGFTFYTAPVGAKDAALVYTSRMTLSAAGRLSVPGGIDAGSSNLSGAQNVGKLDIGNYNRRYWLQIAGMTHGNNYDVIRVPPGGGGATKVILRAHIWLQNLQTNYSYHVREDVWIVCDSGGVDGSRAMGNIYSQQYSINSGVINCSFSYDFLRSSGLQYIRLWPTCTGANSAGGQMAAYVEVILSGDSAMTAT